MALFSSFSSPVLSPAFLSSSPFQAYTHLLPFLSKEMFLKFWRTKELPGKPAKCRLPGPAHSSDFIGQKWGPGICTITRVSDDSDPSLKKTLTNCRVLHLPYLRIFTEGGVNGVTYNILHFPVTLPESTNSNLSH